ncbi:MAG: ParB/RepB/Spo0J family partition protein [Verrucomicrobiota bacterium]|nr:ParB/RepB/Spo0J family partition protein [Verrucomicrobiota bacterium]
MKASQLKENVARPAASRGNSIESAKLRHVRVFPVWRIKPSPENDKLYRPIDPDDPELIALTESVKTYGLKEPLVITLDRFILSGHRRYAAARLAGLEEIPCVVEKIHRRDSEFLPLLREFNRQRVKSFDEKLREEIVSADPEEAYQSLIEHRKAKAAVPMRSIEIVGTKTRCNISPAKLPFLTAILKIMMDWQKYWPLSDRRIHYALLNVLPLKHAKKPDSVYRNDKASYNALTELLTRGRLAGTIPMEAISDETRPVCIFDVFAEPGPFIRREINGFLKGYWRDLQQSQPCHIEIVGEKNTIGGLIRPVAEKYCIPMTTGRGYCSLRPRYDMQQRFRKSGKEKLIGGTHPTEVLVRALGPSLTTSGIISALQDPNLSLYNANGFLVGSNENWKDNQRSDIENTGAAPTDDREAAILAVLQPGNYTAVVRGKNNTTGIALVEFYGL